MERMQGEEDTGQECHAQYVSLRMPEKEGHCTVMMKSEGE